MKTQFFNYRKSFNGSTTLILKKNEVIGDEYYVLEAKGDVNFSHKYSDRKSVYIDYEEYCDQMEMTSIDESMFNIQK